MTGRKAAGVRAARALDPLLASGVACALRTTFHPGLLSGGDLLAIAGDLARRGVGAWMLQRFRTEGCPDAHLRDVAPERLLPQLPPLRALVPGLVLR